jgi:mannose-6-phosphate isomerase-like protein (cupin superfamily)
VSHRVVHVTDVPSNRAPLEELDWRPVRHHLDVTAFGTNAYVAKNAGDLAVEDHDEDEFEELYVVLNGAARFTVDGETFDAPQGTLVLVTPPSRRVAHATEPDTIVLAVGAIPGQAYVRSEWEERWLSQSQGPSTQG